MAAERPRVRVEPNPKWIRGVVDGVTVVDSTRAQFVWEVPYYPAWYFPVDDVAGELVANGGTVRSPSRGEGTRYDLAVGERTIADAAWRHVDSPVEALRDLVRVEWTAMDAWFEENTEVFVHPRSPEVRVDALPSTRHVRVSIGGQVVADSVRPTILYETGSAAALLPTEDRRPDGSTDPDRHLVGVPVQGVGELLEHHRRRCHA